MFARRAGACSSARRSGSAALAVARRRHERGRPRAARLDGARRASAASTSSCSTPAARRATSALDVTDEQVEGGRELLLLAPIRLVRLCRPHLEASGHGRVVAITSSAVKEPIDNLALSSAVRPGLVGWLKTAARELGPAGVTVNCVAPGRIDTDRIKEVYPDGPERGRPRDDPARGDSGTPREVGDVVCFLASDRGAYVTGHDDRRRRRPDAEPAVKPCALDRPRDRARSLIAVGAAWLYPADSYLLLPDRAKPLADAREGRGREAAPARRDLLRRRDRAARHRCSRSSSPFTRPDGSDLVPERAIVPPGSNYQERRAPEPPADGPLADGRRRGRAARARLQGRRQAGRGARRRCGAGSPADGKLEPTEVIVGVDGKPVTTPDDLRRLIAKHEPGETVKLSVRGGGATRTVEVGTIESPRRARPARSSASRSSSRRTSSCRSTSRSISAASAARRPGSPSPSTSSKSCAATSTGGSGSPRRASSSSTAPSPRSAASSRR